MNFPLALTVSRLVFAVAIGAILVTESLPLRGTAAAIAFIIAAATDFFDGRLARAWNQKTDLGAFIDPLADKLLVYLAFMYLTVVGVYPVWLLMAHFVRDIAVDSLRAYAAGKGVSMPANVPGKWKSFLQMGSIALVLVLVAITELQRTTEWGSAVFETAVGSVAFEAAFAAVFWLMLSSAAVGYVSMVQYFTEAGRPLFRSRS
jgi:CDP-diacylglycerol--glycerol-3-phosphate 3-phosphatidyltransferase